MEDGGGAVLEPKDFSGSRKSDEDVHIQLNCSRGRVMSEKRLFKAKYVFDCVRKSRLLPNLSEYLCNQKQRQERRVGMSTARNIDEKQIEEMRDPFEVYSNP